MVMYKLALWMLWQEEVSSPEIGSKDTQGPSWVTEFVRQSNLTNIIDILLIR